jgi:hypothetical protein
MPDDIVRTYSDGLSDALVWSHAIAAHMLDCPEAKKTDIVSQTPEYKIGFVEALLNVMNAIDRRITEIKSHDHDHNPHRQDHHHEQQPSEQTTGEPPGKS